MLCIETVVGPLHHSLVERWGRQQHDYFSVIIYVALYILKKRTSHCFRDDKMKVIQANQTFDIPDNGKFHNIHFM